MFTEIITPRLCETDGLRHINNTTLSIWFEHARLEIFRIFVPEDVSNFDAWELILARSEYDFLAQIYFGSDVEIRTWIKKLGNSSFTVEQEAWQNGHICTRGLAVGVHFDFTTQKSKPIPENIRRQLSKHFRKEGE